MGRRVGPRLATRFARSILELGGNNAAVVCESADLELTLRGIAFAAMGTAGQRCTTLRRLIVHESIAEELLTPTQTRVSIGLDRGSARTGYSGGTADRQRCLRSHAESSR